LLTPQISDYAASVVVRLKSPHPWRRLARLLLLLAAAASVARAALPWGIRSWQSDVGLPDNTVVGIEQTPDGFLWVATPGGLVRFDGLQFQPFLPVTTAGVPASLMEAILVDRRGRLWVAMEQGTLVCVDHGRTTVLTRDNGLPDAEVHQMLDDAAGGVWVSYLGGGLLRIEDGKVRAFTAEDGLPGGRTRQVALGKDGQLWFATGKSLGVYRDGRFRTLAEVTAQRIVGARGGGVWICTGKQLLKFAADGTLVRLGLLPSWEPNTNPTVLYEDRSGNLWIGTREAGVFRYDSANLSFERLTEHQEILSIKEDRDGNVWIGTRGGGLTQFKPRAVDLQNVEPSFPFAPVSSLCQDRSGLMWAVRQNGMVWWNNGTAWSPMSDQPGWSELIATSVTADATDGVWIGTQGKGLWHWQNQAVSARLDKAGGLAGESVTALLTGPAGELWIGTRSGAGNPALQCRRAEQMQTFALPAGSGTVVALAVDAAGDCWTATARGLLLRVRKGVLSDATDTTFAQARAIRCLLATADGSLWIGYGGDGLGRLKAGRFSHCRMEQGLHDDFISQILTDGRGRLWLAGNRGIFSVRERELDEVAAGRLSRVQAVAYGQHEGLPRLQASHGAWPAALRDQNGSLWFAMQSGYAVVQPQNLQDNPAPPSVVLERVTVNGKTVAAYAAGEAVAAPDASASPVALGQGAAHLRVLPGQRQVEFTFTALSFKLPESIVFKYRLHGLDKDWVEAGHRRSASYPQVPAGDYRFQVLACNSDGVWNETGAAVALTVMPNWWETSWFRVLAPLAAVGVLGGGVLLVLRRRHRRQIERLKVQQATERERVRIAQDLHDDLGAGLTEIAMLSEVVRQHRGQPQAVDTHAQRIFRSASEMTQALDEIVWAVNPTNDSLDKLVSFTCEFARAILEPAGIRCRLDLPDQVPELDLSSQIRHQLCMALKECLNNVLKHARASEVHIRIGLLGRQLSLAVEDDGAGFDPAALPDRTGTHDGLDNLRQRLAEIHGVCEIHSAPGQGTRVLMQCTI
jgi:ligand-binding sensor domain-containing protein/signal transduction histidine kinase